MPVVQHPVIHLQVEAPAKPANGATCNGCGVCCAWQPCPLGVLVTGQRSGTCRALQWHPAAQVYRCGMADAPETVWPRLPGPLQAPLRALARRWIAAGVGCDCSAEVEPAAG